MPHPFTACLLVGSGGLVGSVARYGLSLAAQRFSLDWPIGTLTANALGCFAVGLIAEAAARGQGLSPEARLLLATGFCGGFTTLSSLVYETFQMLKAGDTFHASFYLGGTLVLSMAAFLAGVFLVKLIQKSAGV
jgi:fluoride exporter